MKPAERAKQLTADHWGYVGKTLEIHGIQPEELEIIRHHYVTSGQHFYLHAIEDERNGMFKEAAHAPREWSDKLRSPSFVPHEENAPLSDLYLHGNLCSSCQRKQPCKGDYPATSDGGCEGYISALRERMLDAKGERRFDGMHNCANYKPETCIDCYHCPHFAAKTKQDAPKTDEPTPAHTDPATNCKDCGNSLCVGVGRDLTCDQGCERFTPKGEL